jgi:hydroxypyruvate isomerase
MKYSACIETIFTEVPFEERFQLAKRAGFEYVEFWTWESKNIERIKQLSDAIGIRIASFSGDDKYSMIDSNESKKYIDFLKESLKIAKYLNCQHLVIHSDALMADGSAKKINRQVSDYEKFVAMYDVLKSIAPLAEKEEVVLVLEPLNTIVDHKGYFLDNTKTAAELINLVNSPYVKVLYDVYHMQIMEGNIIDTINKYVKEIGYIHVADVPGRQEPGTGEINYTKVIEALRKVKYDNVIGFELFPSKDCKDISKIVNF